MATCGRFRVARRLSAAAASRRAFSFSRFRGVGVLSTLWAVAVCSHAWEPSAWDLIVLRSECPLSDLGVKTASVSLYAGSP